MKEKQYLQHVRLQGYRTIQDVEVGFKPGLNIIIGSNGSGKTNFFNFLNEALNFSYKPEYPGISTILEFGGRYKLEVLAERGHEDKSKSVVSEPFSFYGEEQQNVNFRFKIDGEEKGEFRTPIQLAQQRGLEFQSNMLVHGVPTGLELLDLPGTFKLRSSWGVFNNSSSAKLSDSYFLNTIWAELFLTLSGYSGLVENKLAELKLQIERKIETVLATLESDLGKFSPIKAVRLSSGLSVYYDARINEIIVKNLQLEFLIHDSWLPFSSLSDGTRRLFLLIADLSLKNRYYFRAKGFGVHQGEFNRIVLIEEPELGIHPHQLHQLMVFLKEQSVDKQLILTTHSPQVLDVLTKDELDAIIICEYDEEKKTQLRQLTEKEKKDALAYMEDSMYLSDFWRFSDLNKN